MYMYIYVLSGVLYNYSYPTCMSKENDMIGVGCHHHCPINNQCHLLFVLDIVQYRVVYIILRRLHREKTQYQFSNSNYHVLDGIPCYRYLIIILLVYVHALGVCLRT